MQWGISGLGGLPQYTSVPHPGKNPEIGKIKGIEKLRPVENQTEQKLQM